MPNRALQKMITRTTNEIRVSVTMLLAESGSGLMLRGK
jgi:hypothetical protein